MTSLTYRITTLGCRANHAESREIESLLRSRGMVRASVREPADLELIHTCSVTNTAAAKSRHAIRKAMRRGKPRTSPQILITGCYAGTNPDEATRLLDQDANAVIAPHAADGSILLDRLAAQVDHWLNEVEGTPHHQSIRQSFGECSENARSQSPSSDAGAILPLPVIPPVKQAGRHIRAELRIQDGCDAHCTFCVLPKIRPTLRSKRVSDAVAEAKRLVELGHQEIVLTGIFIGAFGHETALRRKQRHRFAHPLADLIDAVAQVPGLQRLRLSSMEPGDASEPLLDAMVANQPVLVPHLHLPLQSGSDTILKRMNRQYRVGEYLDMIDAVNEWLTFDDLPPAITTDIICGFPGETEEDFQQTIRVARRVGYLHMHVFPFSPKQGTAAARWRDQFIDPATIKRRVRTLINMETDPACGFALQYRKRLAGRTIRVILEQEDHNLPGMKTGRCDHYALIHVRTDRLRGTLMYCRVSNITPERTFAEPIDVTLPLPVMR
jgi:threonylcarbamoyladenosine tRNA methylthiotransferase MtaB